MVGVRSTLLLTVLFCLPACGGLDDGAACVASEACDSGLCYANVCLQPTGDEDKDGLTNGVEHKLRSHPLKADTDGDGKLDADEVGGDPAKPWDSDFDGKPDLIESLTADIDRDCLPDERDADDAAANADLGLLKAIACSNKGVCAGQTALVAATCPIGTGGTATCVYDGVPGYAPVELCDGVDNDCDGLTDEDNTWQGLAIGQPCTGRGGCAEDADATVTCHNGKATCSANPDGSNPATAPESCDGIDNDCDGQTDESFAVDGLPVGAPCLGKGECGVGVVTCGAAGVAMCSTMPGGPDDGSVDESCNNKDDDCDGATDEALTLAGKPLGAACDGVGACGAGTVVCGAAGVAICSTEPGGPNSEAQPESCNDLDDNCNGQTDEGLAYNDQPLGAVCWGVGACGKGVVVCSETGKATCSTMPQAPASGTEAGVETCNGKDDDCDGQTDEGFLYQGQKPGGVCDGIGACGPGVVQCADSGVVTCSSNPDGDKSHWSFEQCNNVDDDCDGVTDEEVPATFGPKCPATGVCVGHKGVPVCNTGSWSCDFPGSKAFEGLIEQSCDGQDNDCDGLVDEGLPHSWPKKPTALTAGVPAVRQAAATCRTDTAVYLLGGRVMTAAATVLSGELWRFDLQKKQWQLLLHNPLLQSVSAALVCVAKGPKQPARLWRIDGRDGNGKPADNIEIDLTTLAISSPSWGGPLQHRDRPIVAYAPKSGRLWLGSADQQAPQVPLQTLDLQTDQWTLPAAVPQPAFGTQTDALCASSDGTIHALSRPLADHTRDYAVLFAGAKQWKVLTKASDGSRLALRGGQLACLGNDALLVAGQTAQGAYSTVKWSGGKWTPTNYSSGFFAGCSGSLQPDASLVFTCGTTDGRFTTGVWSEAKASPGQPTALDRQPAPTRSATWVQAAGALYRIGGTLCSPPNPCPATSTAPTVDWRLAAGQWSVFGGDFQQVPQPRVRPVVVADIDHGRLLHWGGWGPKTGDGWSALAHRIDLVKKTWVPLKAQDKADLPLHLRAPMVSRHHPSNQAWLYGPDAKGTRHLVSLQLGSKTTSTALWNGTPSPNSPAPSDDGVLLYDHVLGRLVLLETGVSLRAWAFDLGAAKGWTAIGQDTSVSGGRVRIVGDAGIANPIAIIGFAHNGPPAVTRSLKLGASVTFGKSSVQLGALSGPFELLWQRNEKRAVVLQEDDKFGHPVSQILALPWLCDPP